jgi:hypothetical protein
MTWSGHDQPPSIVVKDRPATIPGYETNGFDPFWFVPDDGM